MILTGTRTLLTDDQWAEVDFQADSLDWELERWAGYAAFAGVLLVYLCTMVVSDPFQGAEHIIQAWQWLHGCMNVDGYGIHEIATWRGHEYILHPPLPTIVDLPFVALLRDHFHQEWLSVVVGAWAASLVYRLTKSFWLTVFFAFGTPMWYEATLGATWGFCAVLSCVPTLYALIELRQQGRPLWIGVWAGLASLARYDLVVLWPCYVLMWRCTRRTSIHGDDSPLPGSRSPLWLPGFLSALLIYGLYNYGRYGTVYDLGLHLWYAVDPSGQAAFPGHGPFSLHYLPWNVFTTLFMGPTFSPNFPWMIPTPAGQSLLLTSPALLLALAAPWRKDTALLWLAAILAMGGCETVWSNGVMQFGARYWIQDLPLLVLLMATALESRALSLEVCRALTLVSLFLTAWGMAVIRLWGWP